MSLPDLVIAISAGLLLAAVAIVATFACLARRLPPHDQDLDRLLAEMAKRKDACP